MSHYTINNCDGMDALREMFPDGKASVLNFVLFSTSGVHGSYWTIEEAERSGGRVTFLAVSPRLVRVNYGNCVPQTKRDFTFLKRLRKSSWAAMARIGRGTK